MATSARLITSPALFPEFSQFFGLDSVGCVLTEHDGRIVSVTPSFATMLDSEVEALFGQSVFELLTLDEGQVPVSLLADGQQLRVVMSDGHLAYWSAHKIAPGAALSGYYVGLLWDERGSFSRQFDQRNRLATLGGLTAGMAHEIAGPLNLIANNADLLLDESGMPGDACKGLTTIRNEAFRLSTLLQELLNFAGEAPLKIEDHEPLTLVNKSLELFKLGLIGKEISWRIEAEEALPLVVGDAERLQQVFFNLFKNAWDASPESGEVVIIVRRQTSDEAGAAIEFVIEDKGKGIDPSDLHRVGDPFFTTKPAGQGTGLGLAIVQRILATHQGSLRLVSAPGEGTTATVSLPISTEEKCPRSNEKVINRPLM